MNNKNIVIKHIRNLDGAFIGNTNEHIVKWFANVIKKNMAIKIQKVTKGQAVRRNYSKKKDAAKKIQSMTTTSLIPRIYKRKENARVMAFSLLNDVPRSIHNRISKANKQANVPAALKKKIEKVQRPLYLRLKDFIRVFMNLIKKRVNIHAVDVNNGKIKNKFIHELKESLDNTFDLDELGYYTKYTTPTYLLDGIWYNLNNEREISNIINKEEKILYKATINDYLEFQETRDWIEDIYKNGRSYKHMKELTEHEELVIEQRIEDFIYFFPKLDRSKQTRSSLTRSPRRKSR